MDKCSFTEIYVDQEEPFRAFLDHNPLWEWILRRFVCAGMASRTPFGSNCRSQTDHANLISGGLPRGNQGTDAVLFLAAGYEIPPEPQNPPNSSAKASSLMEFSFIPL
jgi:hypothetical protein